MSKADILESLRSLYASSCFIAAEAVAERAIEEEATYDEIAAVTDARWAKKFNYPAPPGWESV